MDISPHLDPDQLGGLPGCSIEHYLVQMLDFVHRHLDNNQSNPTAVLVGLVDFSKAFNRIDHNNPLLPQYTNLCLKANNLIPIGEKNVCMVQWCPV